MKNIKYLFLVCSVLAFVQCKKETASLPSPRLESGVYNPTTNLAIGTLNGTINVGQFGHVWDTFPSPTITNAPHSVFIPTSTTSSDVIITSVIQDLQPDKTYYIRAYAIDAFDNIFFSEQQTIYISEDTYPVACFTASKTECEVGNCFIDFDASCSENAVVYQWDFDGDGIFDFIGDDTFVTSVYDLVGTYNIKLVVVSSNNIATEDTLSIQVTEGLPSVACFIPSTTETEVNETVYFDASCSQNAVEYRWNFGDIDTTVFDPLIGHAYTIPGSYEIRLTVQNISSELDTVFTAIQVNEDLLTIPTACFLVNQTTIEVGETVFFDASCSENAIIYGWDFDGDGSFEIAGGNDVETVNHTYSDQGIYLVRLEVQSIDGSEDTHEISIQVIN